MEATLTSIPVLNLYQNLRDSPSFERGSLLIYQKTPSSPLLKLWGLSFFLRKEEKRALSEKFRKLRHIKNLKVSSITDRNLREQNEDSRLIIPKQVGKTKVLIAAVFDGMGGTEAGEEASGMAKDLLEAWFHDNYEMLAKNNPEEIKDRLLELLISANEKIYLHGQKINKTLGTTSAILLLINEEYIAVNIGDSRIYKFGSKKLQITKDQTLAQLEVDRGNLTPEEALTDSRSHTLIQSLGYIDDPEPDFYKGKCKKGDIFFLCSDGMYNRVSIDEMEKIIKNKDLSLKSRLIEIAVKAKKAGESDNITGLLIVI